VLVSLLSSGTNQNTSLNKATYPMPEFILSCLTGCLAKKANKKAHLSLTNGSTNCLVS
jgi:hypothetical protein